MYVARFGDTMGSGYYGEVNMGSNNNVSSSSSSQHTGSRRGKKSSNSPNKPKQPQRGLGVAQLEKIRLHGQLGCTSYSPPSNNNLAAPYMAHHNLNYPVNPLNQDVYGSNPTITPQAASSYGLHQPNMLMGFGEPAGPDMRWNLNRSNTFDSQEAHYYPQSDYMTRPFLTSAQGAEALRNHSDWGRSSSHDSESSETQQEVDLELRL